MFGSATSWATNSGNWIPRPNHSRCINLPQPEPVRMGSFWIRSRVTFGMGISAQIALLGLTPRPRSSWNIQSRREAPTLASWASMPRDEFGLQNGGTGSLAWSTRKGRSSWLRDRRQQARPAVANGAGSYSAPFLLPALKITTLVCIYYRCGSKPAPLKTARERHPKCKTLDKAAHLATSFRMEEGPRSRPAYCIPPYLWVSTGIPTYRNRVVASGEGTC